jgi:hypothetical protein
MLALLYAQERLAESAGEPFYQLRPFLIRRGSQPNRDKAKRNTGDKEHRNYPCRPFQRVRQRRHVCGNGGGVVPRNAGPWDTEACSETTVGEGKPSAFTSDAPRHATLAEVHAEWAGTKTDWHDASPGLGKQLLQLFAAVR